MKIQIVNDGDKLVGLKERSEIDYQNDIYRVAALWLRNSNDEVLIAQRKLSKDKDPGKWGPAVAGTLEEGETYESNIAKEADEEIGLVGVTFEKGPKERVTSPRNFFTQWFTASVDKDLNEFTTQEAVVEKIAWVPESELIKDVKENPDKYIPTMPGIIELFYGDSYPK